MNNPTLVTTPRTGSTLICNLLFNIAKFKYSHIGHLGEYFRRYNNFNYYLDENNRIVPFECKKRITEDEKLKLLKLYPLHTFKTFSKDLYDYPDVKSFILNNYDIIFLERKNKLEQFLSLCYMKETKVTHYSISNTQGMSNFSFNNDLFNFFIHSIKCYKDIKKEKSGKIIYYEDFMESGGDLNSLCQILEIEDCNIPKIKIKTKKTPLIGSYEDLILNKDEWLENKPRVVSMLNSLDM